MGVVFKEWITPADLREFPRSIFVFGDNVARRGLGGLAGVCRGKPNALGVVRTWPSSARPAKQAQCMVIASHRSSEG